MRTSRLPRLERCELQILRVRPVLRALTLVTMDLTRLAMVAGALVLAVDRVLALL
jgi:hypothetical protein